MSNQTKNLTPKSSCSGLIRDHTLCEKPLYCIRLSYPLNTRSKCSINFFPENHTWPVQTQNQHYKGLCLYFDSDGRQSGEERGDI